MHGVTSAKSPHGGLNSDQSYGDHVGDLTIVSHLFDMKK